MAMTLEYRFFGPPCIVRVSLVQCPCSEQALMVCVRTSWKLLHNGPVVRYTELGAQRAMSGASGMRDASVRFTGLLIEPR